MVKLVLGMWELMVEFFGKVSYVVVLFESGKVKEAINEFREGVSLSPSNSYIRYGLALALLKDNNKKAALAEFRKTVELAPQGELAQKAKDYITTLR
jgi:Flp pilus assembly protein TadD